MDTSFIPGIVLGVAVVAVNMLHSYGMCIYTSLWVENGRGRGTTRKGRRGEREIEKERAREVRERTCSTQESYFYGKCS